MLLELIELKKYIGAFRAKGWGGGGGVCGHITAFLKYGSTPIPGIKLIQTRDPFL